MPSRWRFGEGADLREESVIDNAKPFDPGGEKPDTDRLQKWLENLDPDELGKYKM
jgi:hypothetical protein